MSSRRDLGPWQVALLSLLGTTLASIVFLLPKAPRHSPLWLSFVIGLGLLACGFTLDLKFLSDLRNGVANRRWTDEKLQSLRLVLESPYCTAFNFALLVMYVAFQFLLPHLRGIGWVGFLFSTTLSQLTMAVRRPRAEPPKSLPGWHDLSPIHSDHWGQR